MSQLLIHGFNKLCIVVSLKYVLRNNDVSINYVVNPIIIVIELF